MFMERTSSAVVGSLSVTEPVTGGVRFVHAALLASVNGPWLTTFQNGGCESFQSTVTISRMSAGLIKPAELSGSKFKRSCSVVAIWLRLRDPQPPCGLCVPQVPRRQQPGASTRLCVARAGVVGVVVTTDRTAVLGVPAVAHHVERGVRAGVDGAAERCAIVAVGERGVEPVDRPGLLDEAPGLVVLVLNGLEVERRLDRLGP